MKMKTIKIKIFTKKRGFTLIEVIMSIVILSIISAFAGMGFISAINGYVLAKKNADTVQNAEVILARLAKEFSSTTSITSGTQTSLTFFSKSVDQTLILSWNGGTQTLSLGTDVLASQVALFNFKFHDKYDDTGYDVYRPASTAIIKITLNLTGADNVAATFEELVFLSSLMTGI
jgi:prepilin-type N-terminal cleavage/methylation domain-containing protein